MKNTVTVKQLADFMGASRQWLQSNPNNQNSPLATCINKVTPGIVEVLKPMDEMSQAYNAEVGKLKIHYADKVQITENSQSPEQAITMYEYKGPLLEERQKEIQAAWDKFVPKRDAILNQEVEIEVSYVDRVPTENILPPMFITVFRGIVISPTHDSNIKLMK